MPTANGARTEPPQARFSETQEAPHRTGAELELLIGGKHRAGAAGPRAAESPETEDERAAAWQWLADVPTKYLACRGKHAFPRLVVKGGKLPQRDHR